jgi:DNA-binding MarR family transcriptional regulator
VTEPCPHCRGTGRTELSPEYRATYDALRRAGEIHGAALAVRIGCSGPAANNRLAVLEAKGLATSRTVGRKRLYTAVAQRRA